MKLHGSCFCKEITFEVAGPVSWEGNCHCTLCQKLNGAPFVTWCGFKTDDYKINDPKGYFKIYNCENSQRGFCSNCGTPFFFEYLSHAKQFQTHGKEVFFTRTNITDQKKLGKKVPRDIFEETKASWLCS